MIVWNDPVNLMTYVVYVLQKLFGYSREKATRLMLQVHHDGKAVVSDGTREKAEAVRRARKLARKKLQREGLLPMKPKPVFGAGPGGAERGGAGGRRAPRARHRLPATL